MLRPYAAPQKACRRWAGGHVVVYQDELEVLAKLFSDTQPDLRQAPMLAEASATANAKSGLAVQGRSECYAFLGLSRS